MAYSRKQITFDLDTKALEKYYPSDSWRNAYEVIRNHMEKNDFGWIQGSAYVSNNPMSSRRVTNILRVLVQNNPWLNKCMRDCKETNIGKEFDKNVLFDKSANVPTRAELQAAKINALYAENPIGDDDWFYNHPDRQAFEAVYFNPNSNAGGQYVIMTLPYDLIKDAARQTNDAQLFFAMLEERASYTELVDITDKKNFRATMESYRNQPADFVGRTDSVMRSLVERSSREEKTASMSDYASRIAERKARDAGKTASEAKAKAKNGKDRSE
jgi:virulence-associated protein VapD